jgi:hypothetical protein
MKKLIQGLMAAIFCAGCVVTSVHPFYSDATLFAAPSLAGRWIEPGEKSGDVYEFKPKGEKQFILSHSTGAEAAKDSYVVRPFKLGSQIYLDVFTTERSANLIPGHQVWKVGRLEPLEVQQLDMDWLKKTLAARPSLLRHERISEAEDRPENYGLALTASTRELQAFLSKQAAVREAWGETGRMVRK